MALQLNFTPLARAFAEAKSSLDAVARGAADEIDQSRAAGMASGGQYSFELGGQLFLVTWPGGDSALIDTATYVEGQVLDAGPFKGQMFLYPKGDSEED